MRGCTLSSVEIQDVYLIQVHVRSMHNKDLVQDILPPVYLTKNPNLSTSADLTRNRPLSVSAPLALPWVLCSKLEKPIKTSECWVLT